MWMKSAFAHAILVIFLLFDGLATDSLQLESYAQIFAGDLREFEPPDNSFSFSSIGRPRPGGHKLTTAAGRTALASDILFYFVFPYRLTPLPTHGSKQSLHRFDVILRI
jgi:hypothetical protein